MIRTLPLFFLSFIASGAEACRKAPPPQVQTDLVLRARLTSAAQVQPGQPVVVELSITNRSKETKHYAVKPGDGSEAGWREPHLSFSATLERPDGKREEVKPLSYGRCGLFDAIWQADIVELEPGETVTFKDWVPYANHFLDFEQAGKVELRVHYSYDGPRGLKGQRCGVLQHPIRATPAYTLVSKPVRFEIVRPLELSAQLKPAAALRAGEPARLSEVFDLGLMNRSEAKLTVRPGLVWFAVHKGVAPDVKHVRVGAGTLEPAQRTALELDGTWKPAVPGKLRVRAFYDDTGNGGPRLKSAWMTVDVQETTAAFTCD